MALREECDHGDIHILCPVCDADHPLRAGSEEAKFEGVVLVARFPGRCLPCGEDMEGKRVVMHPEEKVWVHEECA